VSPFLLAILLSAAAGAMIPLGGWLGRIEHHRDSHLRADLLHGAVAFGGGALMAAVMLVLLPLGLATAPGPWLLPAFLAGAGLFLGLDVGLRKRGTRAAVFIAMVLDYVPEAMALGAALALGSPAAFLLAFLVGIQNLPEAFSATKDLQRSRWPPVTLAWLLWGAFLVGPMAATVGFAILPGHPFVLGVVLSATSGGIIALLLQEIIPESYRKGHVAPTWGGIAGFSMGLAGHLLV